MRTDAGLEWNEIAQELEHQLDVWWATSFEDRSNRRFEQLAKGGIVVSLLRGDPR